MGILSAFRFAFQNLFFTPILYGVIASLAVFSTVWEQGDRFKDQLTDRFRSQDDTFDFIIVGGGSSGAVLANRLSQFHTVLLLESGGETHPFQAIPGLAIFLPKNPGTDWMHKSVTQSKSCQACRHKKYILSQGKNLGGSGNLNYMVHLRGNPLDFDNWETITADPTWGYKGVLPYFILSENFVGKTTDETAHGYGGPLQIQIPDYTGLANEWNQAGIEMGYQHIDLNGRHTEGFDTVYYPIKHGVRQATYRAYIQPVRSRASLLIRKFAHVNKVLIREGTNEAYGVEYDRHGHRKHAFANKEVILSAGTLSTPKLLILSGVGQLEHLQALHIPARSVLPVGKNLHDHVSTLLGPFYINKAKTISFDRDIDKQSFIRFATSGKGPLSTTGFQATAMVASSIAKSSGQGNWPDIQLTLFGLTPHRMFYSDIAHAFGIRDEILHRYYGDATGKENAFFIMVTLARPLSKGDFCVPSKNPYRPAVIDPNYLNDPEGHDIKVLIEGIHRALFLAENTTIFRHLETVYSPKCFPGCENIPFRSDVYWECYARAFTIANNDHVGTCPMGQIGSPYAVVDPELRVQGIKRLRVVDASVMPTITGAPTQAAAIMIAERASAIILDNWKHEAKTFYGPPGQKPGNPLSQYGPPGQRPGPTSQYGPPPPPGRRPVPSTQYGPPPPPLPSRRPTLTTQYGPPAPPGRRPVVHTTQYEPPATSYGVPTGLKPPPVAGGDGFANYDSFSVIRDQLNPTQGPGNSGAGPTQLIPLQPVTQVWSSPRPFPSSSAPQGVNGILSTPNPALSPEPSVLLQPPGQLPDSGPPPFATSYQEFESNIGPVVSTTPYPISFTLDTSRSEKTFAAGSEDNGVVSTNSSTSARPGSSRQGKAFGVTDVPPLEEGNQLGEGFEEEEVNTTPFPEFYLSSTSTTTTKPPFREVTAEVINQGPGFRVVRKRIRTTPRVIVHPRGHLGHQNVSRKALQTKFNESIESLFLTTSSVRPVPKDIVKIRRRRPVPFRRRTTTTPAPNTESYADFEETTLYPNDLDVSTASSPVIPTPSQFPSELPIELRSPGRKRFVRRMYARPLNFNGKRRLRRLNDLSSDSTTFSPIFVTASSDIVEVTAKTSSTNEGQITSTGIPEKDEENPEEDFTEPPNLELNEENETNDDEQDLGPELSTESKNGSEVAAPVVIFKNIELEDAEDLSRPTRSNTGNKSYFEYNILPDDNGDENNKNPIMPVDLNPIPQILAPTLKSKDGKIENAATIAIDMSGEIDEDENSAHEEDDNVEENITETSLDNNNDYSEKIIFYSVDNNDNNKFNETATERNENYVSQEGEVQEQFEDLSPLTSDEISQISYDDDSVKFNSSVKITLESKDIAQVVKAPTSTTTTSTTTTSTSSPVINSNSVSVSVSEAHEIGDSYEDDEQSKPNSNASSSSVPGELETATPTTSTTSTTSTSVSSAIPLQARKPGSRFNFRVRHKLMRQYA